MDPTTFHVLMLPLKTVNQAEVITLWLHSQYQSDT